MKIPDHQTTKLVSKDFVFQVKKWPFDITCNPLLPTITESFIDLALVKDMKIAMKKLECRTISYGGLTTKVVGLISQTVQVVYNGVSSGHRCIFFTGTHFFPQPQSPDPPSFPKVSKRSIR